jgi:hypothetical protein
MSEKRFKSTLDEDTMSIMPYLVSDNEEEAFYNLQGCVDLLNEQQAEIERLKEQLSLVCKAESSAPYNSVKEVLRRQIFGLDCAAEESANAWNHYCVLNKLFQEQYGEYWDNED